MCSLQCAICSVQCIVFTCEHISRRSNAVKHHNNNTGGQKVSQFSVTNGDLHWDMEKGGAGVEGGPVNPLTREGGPANPPTRKASRASLLGVILR